LPVNDDCWDVEINSAEAAIEFIME